MHDQAILNEKRLRLSAIITLVMFLSQLIGGFLTHSLAIASDAWHLLSDLFSLGLSWYAVRQTLKPANHIHTYGYHRFGSLAAFLNGIILIGISIYIFVQSIIRFITPIPIQPTGMMYLSAIGFIGTCIIVKALKSGESDINVKSSLLHFLGDVFSYLGIFIGAILIKLTGWEWIDPILSLLFSGIILRNAWEITKDAGYILLEAAPSNIQISAVKQRLLEVPEVESVLDIHIWSLSNELVSLSAHLQIHNMEVSQCNELLVRIKTMLSLEFGVSHATIQLQTKKDYVNHIQQPGIPQTH